MDYLLSYIVFGTVAGSLYIVLHKNSTVFVAFIFGLIWPALPFIYLGLLFKKLTIRKEAITKKEFKYISEKQRMGEMFNLINGSNEKMFTESFEKENSDITK